MEKLETNLNYHLQFKPTDRDLINWKAHYDKFLPENMQSPIEYYKSKIDKDGLVTMQIHEFFSVFNDHIGNGSLLPANGQIIFPISELKQYK